MDEGRRDGRGVGEKRIEIAHAQSKTIKIILASHISATDCKPYNKLMKQESSSIVHPIKIKGDESQVTKTEPEFIIFRFIGERVKESRKKKYEIGGKRQRGKNTRKKNNTENFNAVGLKVFAAMRLKNSAHRPSKQVKKKSFGHKFKKIELNAITLQFFFPFVRSLVHSVSFSPPGFPLRLT